MHWVAKTCYSQATYSSCTTFPGQSQTSLRCNPSCVFWVYLGVSFQLVLAGSPPKEGVRNSHKPKCGTKNVVLLSWQNHEQYLASRWQNYNFHFWSLYNWSLHIQGTKDSRPVVKQVESLSGNHLLSVTITPGTRNNTAPLLLTDA